METLLYTKCNQLTIRTVYIADESTFAVVFEYPNGNMIVVDTFTSALKIIERHEDWCKFANMNEETQIEGNGKLTLLIANA